MSSWGHPTQRHIDKKTMDILGNRNDFRDVLSNSNVVELAKTLGVSESYIQKTHQKFDLGLLKANSSSYENEIATWLTAIGVNFIQHEKSLIHPFELDFYLPDHKLAIEFDGLYWHGESQGKTKNYHKNKTQLCKDKGVNLIHIFEDEWLKNKDICKSIILGQIGKLPRRVYARKCVVRELTNKNVREFLEHNHLQGSVAARVNLALVQGDEILALMTFGAPRYNKNIQWELLRLCTKINVQVAGGIPKLWKYFIDNFQVNNMVSYCDKRWFTGAIYKTLGFTLYKSSDPTYWYTDYKQRFHRSKYQKHKLIKMGYDANSTERIITKDVMGLDRIWDVGQDSWFLGK